MEFAGHGTIYHVWCQRPLDIANLVGSGWHLSHTLEQVLNQALVVAELVAKPLEPTTHIIIGFRVFFQIAIERDKFLDSSQFQHGHRHG